MELNKSSTTMENLKPRKTEVIEQNNSINRHQIMKIKENIEIYCKQLSELNSQQALKLVEVNQLENRVSWFKIVVEDTMKKLENEKNVLEKLLKSIWNERRKFEENVKINNSSLQNIGHKVENKIIELEHLELQAEINVLKIYLATTNEKIKKMKTALNEMQ